MTQDLKTKAYERGIQAHLKSVAESGSDVHQNHTPAEICDMMLDKLDLSQPKSMLVLYNIELLFALKKRKFSGPVTFFTQSQEKADLAPKIFSNLTVEYIDKEENPLYHMETKWPDKFDIVIANPPYSKKLDLKFLDKAFDIAKEEVVFVHPATVFVERKGVTKIYGEIVNKIANYIESITIFNGNGIFQIALFLPCSITHLNKNKSDMFFLLDNLLYETTHKLKLNSIRELSYFGYNLDFLSFNKKISPKKNLGTELSKKLNNGKFNVQVSKISGNVWIGGRTKDIKMNSPVVQPDFFEIVKKSTTIGNSTEMRLGLVWEFDTIVEAENFISYCKTNFARMCLSLTKINQNIGTMELSRIPWMDFTQKWTDEKLYAHFNITQEEQAFIKKVIPSYHD